MANGSRTGGPPGRQTPAALLHLFRRCEEQPCPPRKQTKTADGSNRPQPTEICKCEEIQTSAKQHYPGKQQQARAAIDRAVQGKHEKSDCMDELIKDGLAPNIEHSARFES